MGTKIVIISRAGAASVPAAAVKALRVRHEVVFARRHTAPSRAAAIDLLQGAQVLATTNVTLPVLDAELLDALPDLRHIVLYATGYEHLDMAALAARGIGVTTLPEYATNAVAEHALGLMFACATRVHLANEKARGRVRADVSLRGVEITARTLAIVGMGRIGTRLAQLAGALGMRVVGVDSEPSSVAAASAAGIVTTDLASALTEADLVAVCASTRPGQGAILGRPELDLLHRDAFVVNVGRPVLVDHCAIRDALLTRRLRGYAVDEIAFDADDPIDRILLAEGRIIQTAHSAWWRDEVLARGALMFATAIQAAADGTPVDVVAARVELAGRAR